MLLLDRVGAFASAICAVHCLLTGIAIGLLSVAGLGFLGNPIADIVFFGLALGLGSLAVWQGFRKHRSFLPMALYVGGLLSVLVAHFVLGHDHRDIHSTVLAVTGGLMLVAFHIVNMSLHHRCGVCHPEDADPKCRLSDNGQ